MKKAAFLILLILPLSLFAQQMNIISFNIRYATENDGINAWSKRVDMVNGLLNFHEPDIFGLQEALLSQIEAISEGLPGYEWIGVGRDDGKQAGEFSPLFYNTSKFILIKSGTFWLSETPEKPGLGWDASYNRVVTWGKFKSKVTGKHFLVFNTHFDHRGDEARKNSALLIKKKIEEIGGNQDLPVILTGDFNLEPESEPIALIKTFLKDSHEISETKIYGPFGTFNGFDWNAPLDKRIDYIFTSSSIKVLKYAVISDSKNQRWPSDHLPVFVKLQLK
jgi:endonuclease/exonuclease/phosphatase family metal-dependent hydrolase